MQEAILITGKYSAISDDLIQESLNRGKRVFASYADEKPEVPDSIGEQLTYLTWSRRSLLSARSLVLSADHNSGGFAKAIVVCSPEGIHAPLHETQSALIEERIDLSMKGYLFLIKELSAYLLRSGGGDLTILWYDGGAEILAPLDAAIGGAMRELARSLLAFYENEPVRIRGLEASEADTRAVAKWAIDMSLDRSERSSGRWQKYGRSGILPFRH